MVWVGLVRGPENEGINKSVHLMPRKQRTRRELLAGMIYRTAEWEVKSWYQRKGLKFFINLLSPWFSQRYMLLILQVIFVLLLKSKNCTGKWKIPPHMFGRKLVPCNNCHTLNYLVVKSIFETHLIHTLLEIHDD